MIGKQTEKGKGGTNVMKETKDVENGFTLNRISLAAWKWFWKKRYVALALMLSAFLAVLLVIPVFAWLSYQRTLQTVTRINAPNVLVIGAGNKRDIRELELGNIDVTGSSPKKVVFCVYSEEKCEYNLQLAHTTNIGLEYTIYPAVIIDANNDLKYDESNKVTYLNTTFGYGEALEGHYINTINENNSNNCHEKTYGQYMSVQSQAEPWYWKSGSTIKFQNQGNGYYINYYVLSISWENVENNKETDMVYLMAEATGI